MRKLLIIITLGVLMGACKKVEPITSKGEMSYDGNSYVLKNMRVDHVGYSDQGRFVLRVSLAPGTYKRSISSATGYGTFLEFYVLADENDLVTGSYDALEKDSASVIMSIGEGGDTLFCDRIVAMTLKEEPADNNFKKFEFTLSTESNKTVTGSFIGTHIVNYTVDQPSVGTLSFDTIECQLARPVIYKLGHLFTEDCNYFRLVFFSTDARLGDDGSLKNGVCFFAGIHSIAEEEPFAGEYPVSLEPLNQTLYYGHKEGNMFWGTSWMVVKSGSTVGKANILEGSMNFVSFRKMDFQLKDQLGNEVTGSVDY